MKFQKLLKQHGIISSMSRKGNCWDNAVTESFLHTLKTDYTDGSIYATRNEARLDVIYYIEMFYNSQRLHSYIGYNNPNDFEKFNLSLVS